MQIAKDMVEIFPRIPSQLNTSPSVTQMDYPEEKKERKKMAEQIPTSLVFRTAHCCSMCATKNPRRWSNILLDRVSFMSALVPCAVPRHSLKKHKSLRDCGICAMNTYVNNKHYTL